jgi:hypothetical protein
MRFARLCAVVALMFVAACADRQALDLPPPALGDFRLGHDVVVGRTASMIPPSRSVTAEEWEQAMREEVDKRFRRYEGTGLYHLGISIDAYALAIPGVPVVVKPRSILVFTVNVWDNATQTKLNEPKQFTVFERTGFGEASLIGSGITQSKQEQMHNLANNAARAIERYLVENKAWFEHQAGAQPAN